ncbi:hypothetical protein BDZ45DRAFT_748457 [Acephala macrosclerotiorum]|nr:hypothetical protein BDZ45DRAFT_748457 [Acephala macrosclerotiorum]
MRVFYPAVIAIMCSILLNCLNDQDDSSQQLLGSIVLQTISSFLPIENTEVEPQPKSIETRSAYGELTSSHSSPQESGDTRSAKRSRVTLAYQRCKKRKQKCDGAHPTCSKWHRLGLACDYVIPPKPMPFARNYYVASLERRVSELEKFLARKDILDQLRDAPSRRKNSTFSFSEMESRLSDNEDGDSMVRILRNLSLETNGGYIGATSQITMGRLVGSIVKGKKYSVREDLSPIGYMKHIATRKVTSHVPDLGSLTIFSYPSTRQHALQYLSALRPRLVKLQIDSWQIQERETRIQHDEPHFRLCHSGQGSRLAAPNLLLKTKHHPAGTQSGEILLQAFPRADQEQFWGDESSDFPPHLLTKNDNVLVPGEPDEPESICNCSLGRIAA